MIVIVLKRMLCDIAYYRVPQKDLKWAGDVSASKNGHKQGMRRKRLDYILKFCKLNDKSISQSDWEDLHDYSGWNWIYHCNSELISHMSFKNIEGIGDNLASDVLVISY